LNQQSFVCKTYFLYFHHYYWSIIVISSATIYISFLLFLIQILYLIPILIVIPHLSLSLKTFIKISNDLVMHYKFLESWIFLIIK
jgi:hypothetical protein